MNICIIPWDYPDTLRPTNAFVKELVEQWGLMGGHSLTVVSPFSITKTKRWLRPAEISTSYPINIIRPRIATLSNLRLFGRSVSREIVHWAVYNELCKLKQKPDVIYCHFWEQAITAYRYAHENNIPIVVACGESEIPKEWALDPYRSMCNSVAHVVCVSIKNKREAISMGLTKEEKCSVHPNGIDGSIFRVSDQKELRKRMGANESDFVTAFTGWFVNRKGANRVSAAIDSLNDPEIKSIFVGGKGEFGPTCQGIIFNGMLNHSEIPNYLNCADVFVLPTLKEGCCNAIVEAMACGLPIISSDKDFNEGLLDETNSILVDPESVDDIANAIKSIKNDTKLRCRLREGALAKAAQLTIRQRAMNIISELERVVNNN